MVIVMRRPLRSRAITASVGGVSGRIVGCRRSRRCVELRRVLGSCQTILRVVVATGDVLL